MSTDNNYREAALDQIRKQQHRSKRKRIQRPKPQAKPELGPSVTRPNKKQLTFFATSPHTE